MCVCVFLCQNCEITSVQSSQTVSTTVTTKTEIKQLFEKEQIEFPVSNFVFFLSNVILTLFWLLLIPGKVAGSEAEVTEIYEDANTLGVEHPVLWKESKNEIEMFFLFS